MNKLPSLLSSAALILLLAACGQAPSAPTGTTAPETKARPLGTVSLGMYIGTERDRETAVPQEFASSQSVNVVRAQGFPAPADVTFSQATYTMRVLGGSPGDWTFTAGFRVTNNSAQALTNLTMVARSRTGQSLGDTAISSIQGQDGSLTTDPTLARGFQGVNTINSMETVIESAADFQALRRTEAQQLETLGRTAGAIGASDRLLNYGFVARKSNTSRVIPGAGCKTSPTDLCNTGTVSVTFRTPAFPYTGPGSIPSFPLRLTFESILVSDGPNRVTRSQEPTTAAVARATNFGASEVALVGGDTDTAAPKTTVRVGFIGSYALGLSDTALTAVQALPRFQALNTPIDQNYVIGTTTNGKAVLWFADQNDTALFLALVDGTRVEQLLRFRPVGNGFEAVNVLDGRGFEVTQFASLLDANNELGDTPEGYALQAKFAQLVLKNPNYLEFPRITLPASSGLFRPQGGTIPPLTLVDLSCTPCKDKGALLIRESFLFFTGLVSGGVAVSTATRAGFFLSLISSGSVRKALADLAKDIFVTTVSAGFSALQTWSGYDSVVGAGDAYYSCIASNCPPLLSVTPSPFEAVGRPGGQANAVFTLRSASASGFLYSGSAGRGTLTEIRSPPPSSFYAIPLLPETEGVLYGNQVKGVEYKATCPATPSTFTDRVTYTYQSRTVSVDVTVRCSGAVLEPPPPGELILGVGAQFDGTRSFRNIGDAPLSYTVASAAIQREFVEIIGASSGTVAPGGTGSVQLRFKCSRSVGFTVQLFVDFGGNGGSARVPIQFTCLGFAMNVNTDYNGPQDECKRVQAVVKLTSDRWQSAGFNVFIDGVRSTYTEILPQGENRFFFNLTRACNLSEGTHQLTIRFTDTSSGGSSGRPLVVTEHSLNFRVVDNRWPGVAYNNTNRCDPGLGITLARITSIAPGDPVQEVTNVAAGSTARFVARAGVLYTYRAVAFNPSVYDEAAGGLFGGTVPIEGNGTPINGRIAYFGVFFERGSCARTADQAAVALGNPISSNSSEQAYFVSLVR
jgi:hypothetical protein